MNDELIEIDAENLKWVTVGFGFYTEDTVTAKRFFVSNPVTCGNVCFMANGHPQNATTVFVIKKDFEKQCLDRIGEMLGLPLKKIEKIVNNDEPEDPFTYIMAYDIDDNDVHIRCDPRPNVKEPYEINLEYNGRPEEGMYDVK